MKPPSVHPPLCRGLLLALALPAISGGAAATCPDLSGRYHLVGKTHEVDVVLAALASPREAYRRSAIALQGPQRGELVVTLRGGLTADWPQRASARLQEGRDFRCEDGSLQLLHAAQSERWPGEDDSWYRGTASIRLNRHHDGGLQLQLGFEGHQTIDLYSYDSARVGVPKPFSARRFDQRLYWPAWTDHDDQIRRPPAPEPAAVQALRRQLDGRVLGNLQMGTPEAVAGGMLVRFTAPRSDDVVAFEDRLYAAGVRYESRMPPTWTNNRYEMSYLIRDSDHRGASWPSPLRVEHELRRLGRPLAELVTLDSGTEGYVATLRLVGAGRAEVLLARLRQHAALFAEVDLLDDDDAAATGELRLRLRPR